MTRAEIYNLRKLGLDTLAYELEKSDRIISHWKQKAATAEYYLRGNETKYNIIRAKISKALKDSQEQQEDGCDVCGLSCENTDLCNWCYNEAEGLKCAECIKGNVCNDDECKKNHCNACLEFREG